MWYLNSGEPKRWKSFYILTGLSVLEKGYLNASVTPKIWNNDLILCVTFLNAIENSFYQLKQKINYQWQC